MRTTAATRTTCPGFVNPDDVNVIRKLR